MPFDLNDPNSGTEHEQRREAGWRAELTCRFARVNDRTVIAERAHRGPLLVQRAFYPERPDVCHVYLVHPPGGIVGGDRLRFNAQVEADAHALITTPAATKLYRSNGALAEQDARLRVAPNAKLEWLPQETLVFDAAHAAIRTRVELEGDARFLGWELMCLGRPANGETFSRGHLRQRFEIYRDGEPLWIERSEYSGDDDALHEAWGLLEQPVFATMVATLEPREEIVEAVREALRSCDAPGRSVVTALDHVIVCRYVGPWAEAARAHLIAAWRVLRPAVIGHEVHVPRIWNT